MTDYISKEEAIDAISYTHLNTLNHDERIALIANIPSADVREVKELPDGTLSIKVDDALKVGRVLIQDDNHWGGLYYADGSIPKGKWIGNDETLNCSICNYPLHGRKYNDTWMIVPCNYCPNCGADMRRTNHETD